MNLPMDPMNSMLATPSPLNTLNKFFNTLISYKNYGQGYVTGYQTFRNPNALGICQNQYQGSQYTQASDANTSSESNIITLKINECSANIETEDTHNSQEHKCDHTGQCGTKCHDMNSENSNSDTKKCTLLDQYPHEILSSYDENSAKMVKTFRCKHEGCTKEFNKSWNLVYHARVHTNEKPFKCTHCLESFAQKGNLKRHMKIHSETPLNSRKTLQCNICLKKYTTKFNLKVHKQTKHPNLN